MSKPQLFIEGFKAWRRPVMWALQICFFAFSAIAAFLLRFDFALPSTYFHFLAYALPIWIVVKIAVFRLAKLD